MRRYACLLGLALLMTPAMACVDPSMIHDGDAPPADNPDADDPTRDDAPDAQTPDAGQPPEPDGASDEPDADTPDDADADNPDDGGLPDNDADDEPDADDDAQDLGPTRYRAQALRSPVTRPVVDAMRAIQTRADDPDDLVFMKVGASGTVSTRLLHCFAGAPATSATLDLDGREALLDTIEFFRMGDAQGATPFDRETIAAELGQSARWAINGDPSPVDREIAAINPRFALVNYGTNDMGLGATYERALFPFIENLQKLLDELEQQGIIPIVTGLNPRTDNAEAGRWVATFDDATRAVAEARQLPFISLYHAARDLPDQGLISDGIHGNTFRDQGGRTQPCVFTDEGLRFGYNIRNLLTIQAFDDVRRTLLEDATPSPAELPPLNGSGTPDDPFIIDRLPFTHADATDDAAANIDAYPACDNGQDESGPEVYYQLQLDDDATVRLMVFDRDGVDIDLHLLQDSDDPGDCVERDDRFIERSLPAGTHTIVLDTYVSSAPLPGPYLFVVNEAP